MRKCLAIFTCVLIVLIPVSPGAIQFPSMSEDDETLDQYLKRPSENDVENARATPKINPERPVPQNTQINRPASENKSPMQGDNLLEMELPYWPGFEIGPWNIGEIPSFANPPAIDEYGSTQRPTFKFPGEPYQEGETPASYTVGCSLTCPLVRYDCQAPYT